MSAAPAGAVHWRRSCKLCDYVFDDPDDAPGFSRGRLICGASCLPSADDAAAAASSSMTKLLGRLLGWLMGWS